MSMRWWDTAIVQCKQTQSTCNICVVTTSNTHKCCYNVTYVLFDRLLVLIVVNCIVYTYKFSDKSVKPWISNLIKILYLFSNSWMHFMHRGCQVSACLSSFRLFSWFKLIDVNFLLQEFDLYEAKKSSLQNQNPDFVYFNFCFFLKLFRWI